MTNQKPTLNDRSLPFTASFQAELSSSCLNGPNSCCLTRLFRLEKEKLDICLEPTIFSSYLDFSSLMIHVSWENLS